VICKNPTWIESAPHTKLPKSMLSNQSAVLVLQSSLCEHLCVSAALRSTSIDQAEERCPMFFEWTPNPHKQTSVLKHLISPSASDHGECLICHSTAESSQVQAPYQKLMKWRRFSPQELQVLVGKKPW